MSGEKDLDYVLVLKALEDIPFGVGKKLLIDFLQGQVSNESIARNRLDNRITFGSLAYEKEELESMIDRLILNGLIVLSPVKGNKFWKVLELTDKGRHEIEEPSLYKRKVSFNFRETDTVITEKEKKQFEAFGELLERYNDRQKKAIISNNKKILCIAGAGSGKTAVLTKRIEFLVKYRSVDPDKVLAITFTRKARAEMMKRLEQHEFLDGVKIETFNSFCEKILRKFNYKIYDQSVRVISYRDKIIMINKALSKLDLDMRKAIDIYFSYAQRRGKTDEQLGNIFLNDCFFIRDYFKFKHKPIKESSFEIYNDDHKKSAHLVFGVCNYIEAFMKKHGLRDFADQLIDTIAFFEKRKEFIPDFDHILVDEYQDVNSTQIKLLSILDPDNLFCVGDPRQSIYGWRGSDIRYIMNFEERYPKCEIITLTKNYRSTRHIVDLINKSIKNLGLADLESDLEGEKEIHLLKCKSEDAEFDYVIQKILDSKLPRNELFVLARTNRQLNELSQKMKSRKISHIVRSDEIKRSVIAKEDDVTLATVHAIKGLEADTVFVIGCTAANFPCKGSEHPVIDMVKVEEYDKEEEERRLFYVAMSRAKKKLYMTYSGKNHTYFITDKMLELFEKKEKTAQFKIQKNGSLASKLKEWRLEQSRELGVPAFMILHDKTLIEIAANQPSNKIELEMIKGFGPNKVLRYGEDILRIINGC